MNVIFIDFDGTLTTLNDYRELTEEEGKIETEKRIALLADICHEFNCKIVISSGSKFAIDEETMEINEDATWVQYIFSLFNKYGIECIGRTPEVKKKYNSGAYIPSWKEDEIRLYLWRHPEINHYCVLDDEDMIKIFHRNRSDLEKVRDHLVSPLHYSDDGYQATGLLESHREEIGQALKKENDVKRLFLRYQNKRHNDN
jgi:hypothetical protein